MCANSVQDNQYLMDFFSKKLKVNSFFRNYLK